MIQTPANKQRRPERTLSAFMPSSSCDQCLKGGDAGTSEVAAKVTNRIDLAQAKALTESRLMVHCEQFLINERGDD